MPSFQAILIDPSLETISKVTIPRGENEISEICKLLECRIISTVPSFFGKAGDRFIIDDEGRLGDTSAQTFFYVDDQKIAGKALYVGNLGSLFATPEVSIGDIFSHIQFKPSEFRAWLEGFLDEKEIDTETSFMFNGGDGFTTYMTIDAIIEQLCAVHQDDQEAVKKKMVEIDFNNGDIVDFLRFLGEQIAAYDKEKR